MNDDEFWQLIKSTKRLDAEEHAERLTAKLAKLPIASILAFGKRWHELESESYSWKLWGAAYLVNGGCSDDSFDYFRDWLILQGQTVFESAHHDPDSLADTLKGSGEVEAECYPAYDAYCAVTGKEDYFKVLQAAYPDLAERPKLGKGWDFDDETEMKRRYPKLYELYLGDFEE